MAENFKQILYNAIRNQDFETIQSAIEQYYSKCDINGFHEVLSTFYDEIHLKGFLFPYALHRLIQNKLIRKRLFEESPQRKPNISDVLKRLNFLTDLIQDLNCYKNSPDYVFVFISRWIAINLHILKKPLRFSYTTLPWEEVEFCLELYVQHTLQPYPLLTLLSRNQILNHLNNFCRALDTEKLKFEKLKQIRLPVRIEIKENILSKYPKFVDLYQDYETLRDTCSLLLISNHLTKIFLSKEDQFTKFALKRTLQVIGEYLKNTHESPNISEDIHTRLQNAAPKDLKRILTSLRDTLTHSAFLEKEYFLEKNYKNIRIELVKIYVETIKLLSEKVIEDSYVNIIKTRLYVTDLKWFRMRNAHRWCEIQEYPGKMKISKGTFKQYCEQIIENSKQLAKIVSITSNLAFEMNIVEDSLLNFEKIECIKDYKTELENNGVIDWNIEAIFDRINQILKDEQKRKQFHSELEKKRVLHLTKSKILNDNFEFKEYGNIIKVFDNETFKDLERLCPNNDLNKIKNIVEDTKDDYGRLKDKIESNNAISFKKYRKSVDTFCRTLSMEEGDRIDVVNILVGDFKKKIKNYLNTILDQLNVVRGIDENYVEIATEQLLLDLLETLTNTYSFTSNSSYLDRDSPLLIGKDLRNDLAHGNLLTNILPFNRRCSILCHIEILKEIGFDDFNEKLNYNQTTDFTQYSRESYSQRLNFVKNQAAMFDAARKGDIAKVEECIRQDAHPLAIDTNGESGLECLIKNNNIQSLLYFLDQNLYIKVENVLEIAVKNNCMHVIHYLSEANSQIKQYIKSDANELLHLAILQDNREMVKYFLDVRNE